MPHTRQADRDELAAQIAAFQKQGGKIEVVPLKKVMPTKTDLRKYNPRNDEVNEQIRLRYTDAPCAKELAKELGLTHGALLERARKMLLKRDQPHKTEAAHRRETARKMFLSGKSRDEIAEHFGMTRNSIGRYLTGVVMPLTILPKSKR